MDVGQQSNLPSRPPASFKGTTARASTVNEKKQNHNISGLKLGKKKKKPLKLIWDTHKASVTLKCAV